MKIGEATAEIDRNTVTLFWPDGTTVRGSHPGGNRNAGPTARKLGYSSMQEMFCEHELTHVALADWLQTPSPVMLALRGYQSDSHLCNLEEHMVLALQAYMRAMHINLLNRLSAAIKD
jgi:hypothetical protein